MNVLRFAAVVTLLYVLVLLGCGKSTPTPAALPGPVAVSVSPATSSLAANGSQAFTATVVNDSNSAGVTWSIGNGAGTLSSTTPTTVTYTAPALVAATSVLTLVATSKTDVTKSASATITLTAPAPAISVSLNVSTVSVPYSVAQTFTAVVANDASNAGVTWNLAAGAGTLTASTRTSVTYTAPAGLPAAAIATLTATSITDSTRSASASIALPAPPAPASQWVYYNASGNLAYKTLPNINNNGANGSDQIMDFSTAGYQQGAASIPTAAVAANVSPSGADDTSAIQAAINTVAALPVNATTGLRGAVLLAPGTFLVSNTLQISASGVVLRGSGSTATGATSSILKIAAATTPYPLVVMGSTTAAPNYIGSATTITDTYVPAGATTIDVASAAGLAVGSTIMINRPVTQAWINFMGMNAATAPIDNCSSTPCNWITAGDGALQTDRTIVAISGNKITLDAPMSDSIDSTYCGVNGATVRVYSFAGRISQVGVENLRAIAPVPATNLVPPTASYQLVVSYAVLNGWIRNLTAQDTLESVVINSYGKQITVSNVAITHTVTQTQSAKFMEFYIQSATQVLMDTVSDTADNMFFFSTSSATQGPNVLRNSTFLGNTTIEPHQRWATGLLVENTTVAAISSSSTTGGINFYNRGDYGSGHGWTIGWGVAWNTTAGSGTQTGEDIFQQPPGSQNWCIGCKGIQGTQPAPGGSIVLPQGAIDSTGTYVFPASLYQAQLTQRLAQP